MEASAADGVLAKEIEDELMKYTKTYDHKVETDLVMKTTEVQTNSDVKVNITECTKSLGNDLVAAEYQDTTETSSSFDDCNSGVENVDTFGDSEVSSSFHDDAASALDFDRFGERMRRKKLTPHWSAFIRPLRWRCKWAELQIKKLQSQAQLYDRQLEAYNEKRWTQLDNSAMVDGIRSVPFSQKNVKIDVFKRKKRRRTESTEDVVEYMSRHNLFSYYENRKSEGAFMNNELKNLGNQKISTDHEILGDDELLSFELGDGDNSVAQILLKIDFLQSEVGKLKGKLDSIVRENAERLSYAANMDFSPPHCENGIEGAHIASQSTCIVPQTQATSYVDVPVSSGSIGPACFEAYKSVEDGVLIDNQRVKEEMNSFEEVKIQHIPLALNDGSGITTPPVITEPDLLADDRAPAKVRSIAKITGSRSKRKRGRKKGSTGRRTRRSTG